VPYDQIAAYEQVAYPTYLHPMTHPERLAALAKLHGLNPPPAARCRVLELGCSDGGSLIPFALDLPHAEFYGVDLDDAAIARGQHTIAALGLRNIRLDVRNVLDLGEADGQFDYILTHGLIGWVPPHVRDYLFAIYRHRLTPDGLVYVSYNTYPGSHFRDLSRGMMAYHTRNIADRQVAAGQGMALLKFLSASQAEPTLYTMLLETELAGMVDRDLAQVVHDELGEFHQPFYFHEFVSLAGAAGLRYVTESPYADARPQGLKPEVTQMLQSIGDPIQRQQYLDFIICRRFRRSVFCRAGLAVEPVRSERMRALLYSSNCVADTPEFDPAAGQAVTFETPLGQRVTTTHPTAQAILSILQGRFPQRLDFPALHNLLPETPESDLAPALLALLDRDLIIVHTVFPRLATAAGETPLASPLVRLQAQQGAEVTSLAGAQVQVEEPLRQLLAVLDGTRTRATLLRELPFPSAEALDRALLSCAQLGLLFDPAPPA
jgi:predicted O-methyltransferase YrrM